MCTLYNELKDLIKYLKIPKSYMLNLTYLTITMVTQQGNGLELVYS